MQTALQTDRFHYGECKKSVGPRGGVTIAREEWRRNGANKTWATDSERFQVPVKYGMRQYGYVCAGNVAEFHAASDCAIND